MKLSIVIVNYNVEHFLEQCLHSVSKAIEPIEAEVFVVDNNSIDGSCAMVKEKFPWVKLIENKENVGFARANNQAIRIAKGEYILLLNPDTVVQEDTFIRCIEFMDKHPEAGALGVKMIDGKGNFLPESKRSLPTPWVAFYKIFGLSALFPKSPIFGKYHLTYLDKEQIHQVDVLSGAFMFIRKKVLDTIGLLDESFFMYGEDIDLSYRITLAGYKNYYFPQTTIIHYKGESTKKGSLNYVIVFYNAMIIFARKHFSNSNFKYLTLLINLAIFLRASLSIVKRAFQKVFLPAMDALVIYAGYLFLKPFWESVKFEGDSHFPDYYLTFIVPIYIFLWLMGLLFAGAYDKPYRIDKVTKGIALGTVIILTVYALLPEDYRFSRLLIIAGAVWGFISLYCLRYLLHYAGFKAYRLYNAEKKRIIAIANKEEALRIRNLLSQTNINADFIGYVSNNYENGIDYLGNLNQLEDILHIYEIDEIIFSGKDLSSQDIIYQMLRLNKIGIEYKIAPPEALSIIGSSSINTSGDLYLVHFNAINKPTNKRMKRLFDLCSALALLLFYPVLFLMLKHKWQLLKNILNVLIGRYSWVGYANVSNSKLHEYLPSIKKGVLNPTDVFKNKNLNDDMIEKLNFIYAKDYKLNNDINILLKGLLYIDRKC